MPDSVISSQPSIASEQKPELEPKNEINKLSFWEKVVLERELIDKIEGELTFRFSYFLLLVSSTIVTTLGLLIDSTAVVIGGMLLAPLFWPILGATVSIIKIRKKLAEKSIRLLILSILFVLGCSFLVGFVVPITTIPNEVLARVNPTILDLFIALAVSVVGVAAVYYPRVSESATGVAVSISLLPPLCVVGIGLALGDLNIAGKSALLFLTNLLAIVVAGAGTLYFLEIRPSQAKEAKRFRYSIIATGIILLILTIPLSFYLYDSYADARLKNQISSEFSGRVLGLNENARIDDLEVDVSSGQDVQIQASLYLPEGDKFSELQRDKLIKDIGEVAGRDTNLELNILNTLILTREEDNLRQLRVNSIEEEVRKQLGEVATEARIEGVEVRLPTDEAPVEVYLKIFRYNTDPISINDRNILQKNLVENLGEQVLVDVEFVPITKLEDYSDQDAERDVIDSVIKLEMSAAFDDFDNDPIVITNENELSVSVDLRIYLGFNEQIPPDFREQLTSRISRAVGKDVVLDLKVLRFE